LIFGYEKVRGNDLKKDLPSVVIKKDQEGKKQGHSYVRPEGSQLTTSQGHCRPSRRANRARDGKEGVIGCVFMSVFFISE